MSNTTPSLGDLRVWHIPQVPMEPFEMPVASIAEGRRLIEALEAYDLFQYEHGVKPDYANASGISRYEQVDDDDIGWFDVDDYETDEQSPVSAIAARAAAATPGPWTWDVEDASVLRSPGVEVLDMCVNDDGFPDIALSQADRDFVANARTDIEVLLALVNTGGDDGSV